MKPTPKYVLVNHQSPDVDSIATTYLWLLANGKRPSDPDIEFAFVPAGQRWSGKDYPPGTIIVHLDTGGRFNPSTHDFDHHQNREMYPSAALTVLLSFGNLRADPLIVEIVELTSRVDSGNTVNVEDDAARDVRRAINEELKTINTGRDNPIILVTEQKGPWEIVDLIANLEVETSEIQNDEKLAVGLIMIEKWHRNQQLKNAVSSTEDKDRFDRLAATFLALHATDSWPRTAEEKAHCEAALEETKSDEAMSATERVFSTLPQRVQEDAAIQEMVDFVRSLRVKNHLTDEDAETAKRLELLRLTLDDFNAKRKNKVIPIVLTKGPWEVFQMMPDDQYNPTTRLVAGLFMLKAWYHKKTIRGRIQDLFKASDWKKEAGLSFVLVPETPFTTKVLRYQLRRYYRDEIDVVVATYLDKASGMKSVGVTRIQDNRLNGMKTLFNRLKELDPLAKIFLFRPSKFVIYVKDSSILTPERVFEEARQILRPIAESEQKAENIEGLV